MKQWFSNGLPFLLLLNPSPAVSKSSARLFLMVELVPINKHNQYAINFKQNPVDADIRTKMYLGLSLLCLLLFLTLFRFSNRLQPCCISLIIGLGSLGEDTLQICTNTDNTSLMFDGLSGTFLGYFFSDALFVHSSVYLSPCDFTWVFALEEQGFIFGGGETEDLLGY